MFETFITVVAAVIVGAILVKFWRPILACTLYVLVFVITLVIAIPMYIIKIPAMLFLGTVSDEKLEESIVRRYDKMFHEASSKEELSKCRKDIKNFQAILKQRNEKKKDKQTESLLEEAKWVL